MVHACQAKVLLVKFAVDEAVWAKLLLSSDCRGNSFILEENIPCGFKSGETEWDTRLKK